MFPMRGFRRHFPFVTPAVTWQVKDAAMFRECVAMSGLYTCFAVLSADIMRRHIAVTLPATALETSAPETYAGIHIPAVSAYRLTARDGPNGG
jgi:hypothetical protein